MIHRLSQLPSFIQARIAMALALLGGIEGGSTDFLPARDADLDAWQINFNTLIQASPNTYGLDASAAAALAPLSAAFTAALILATNPATKTKVTVASKDAAKAALKAFIRSLAKIVQATASVSNDDKAALGLPIHNNAPSPIPPPNTFPIMAMVPSGHLLLDLTTADSATPTSRRKPAGAIALLLYGKASATAITDPNDLEFVDLYTKSPSTIQRPSNEAGMKFYYSGRWVTRTGLFGPWGAVSNVGIAA